MLSVVTFLARPVECNAIEQNYPNQQEGKYLKILNTTYTVKYLNTIH